MPYLFTPPSFTDRMSTRDRLWVRITYEAGQALIKTGGFYTLSDVVADDVVAGSDIAYLGGHVYLVSNDEAADLTAAGFGAGLTPYTEPNGYGVGPYGSGVYGGVRVDSGYGDGIYRGVR